MKDNKNNSKNVNATANTATEGRKEGNMKKNSTTRTLATEEARMKAETVATLRKWAKARGMKDADKMKKAELVAALAADNMKAVEAVKKDSKKDSATADKKKDSKKRGGKKEGSAQKDNKKKDATTAAAAVMTSLKAERGRIAIAIEAQNTQNVEIADALNRIKTMKLYEEAKADSMKDYVNNKCGGKLYGMTYSTVNTYINAMLHVYSMKDKNNNVIFAAYGMHLIQALIVPCRYHGAAVLKAVEECRIRSTMSLASLKDIIKAEAWTSPKADKNSGKKEGSAAAETADSDSATDNSKADSKKEKTVAVDNAILTVNKAVKMVLAHYNKKAEIDKAEALAEAWDAIKAALD